MKEGLKKYIDEDFKCDRITIIAIICLIFVISGIFGFVYEVIFYYFNGGMTHVFWRGGNFLPWINIYAIGGTLIFLTTYRFRKSPLKVFLVSFFLCGILEYFSGLGIYIIGDGLRYWNYNTEILNFGNIGGFICLRSVLFFGVSGLFLIYAIVPICFYLSKKMNKRVFIIACILICSIFLADEIYNFLITKMFDLPSSIDVYKEMGVYYVQME